MTQDTQKHEIGHNSWFYFFLVARKRPAKSNLQE